MMLRNRSRGEWFDPRAVAGTGLLDRRLFLRGGAAMAAAMTGYSLASLAAAEPLADDPWSLVPGTVTRPYGERSPFEEKIARTLNNPNGEPRTQNARTPLHQLNGTFTPIGLHFFVAPSGRPAID